MTAPPGEEAVRIARTLVDERLAACVNLVPGVRSIYRWEGQVSDDEEVLLVIKTAVDRLPLLEARVRELHPYDVPEVVALEVTDGSWPYLEWVLAETTLGD